MQNYTNQNFKNAKREWNSPLNIFLSFVLVVSLLLSFVNITGAWFTDDSTTGKTISAIIKTGEANLNVYQEDSTGTQTLLSKSLPTGYTQLEYIESTGKQYINTNVKSSSNLKISVDAFRPATVTGEHYLFGGRTNASSPNRFTFTTLADGTYGYQFGNVTSPAITTSIKIINQKYNILLDKTGIYINNIYQQNTYIGTFGANVDGSNIVLFGLLNNTSFDSRSWIGKIYSAKIYDNNVLVRNFVPANDSSNVVGMYDLVEGKFYTNKGTGTFVAGAEQKSGSGISLAYDTTNKTNNKVDVENTNNVKLLLKNEDLGSSFGVRYKVTFYAATASGKVELSSSISGMTAPTSSSNGFVFNSTDGYYYYQNSTGANAMFEPATSSGATSKYLMTGFSINYTNATKTLLGGNSIYMEISIESVNV